MKEKIAIVFVVLTLAISGIIASADVVKNSGSGVTTFGEDHITILRPPWDAFDNFDEGTGNMVTDSGASQYSGHASANCDVWGSGWGVGEGYMEHWMNWDCPVGGIEGKIDIQYDFHADAELEVVWGGYTTAKLWLKFYIDDDQYEVVLYDDFVELYGYKQYWNPTGQETWSKTLTLEKKTYKIGVQANFRLVMNMPAGTHSCCSGGYLGNWNGDDLVAKITWPNQAPNKPEIISGTRNGEIRNQYKYTAVGTDIESDNLYYKWDFGDGSSQYWTKYTLPSGDEGNGWQNFNEEGTYNIRVKTKDTYGTESEWSDPYTVTMPRARDINNYNLIARLLERFPNAFQLLQKLLGL